MAAHESDARVGLSLCLAGEFALERAGQPIPVLEVGSRKARTLLKLLAVERGHRLSADRIAEVLWAEHAPARPADNIATLVSRLRAALGQDVIDGSRDGYRLGAVTVDLDEAAAAITARVSVDHALRVLGDGSVLTDEPDADWISPARSEAARLLRDARHVAAESALAAADPAAARMLALAAATTDPWDEAAVRHLMRAEAALGEPARALATYEQFRVRVADEFGADPAPETSEIHVAILQNRAGSIAPPPSGRSPSGAAPPATPSFVTPPFVTPPFVTPPARPATVLVGRDPEIEALRTAWQAAERKQTGCILLTGEAGIGKTRLAAALTEDVIRGGGIVLSARCYEAERSLFLQPIVEALGAYVGPGSSGGASMPPWTASLVEFLPEIGSRSGEPPLLTADRGDIGRRRAYDAIARFLRELGDATPTLLVLDDLHNAGLGTIELLHFVIRQSAGARLLVVATVRTEEAAAVTTTLDAVATCIEVGPLTAAAVAWLADEAGHADMADGILARTRGHTLFVVETLRALTADGASSGAIPESLQAAVLARVRRTGDAVAELLRAAAVLGAPIEPDTLARMLDVPPSVAVAQCEQALTARLLTVADRAYEFANDLIRDVIYATMPAPSRVSYHRRAADLLGDRPEAVGAHAAAAADWARAARAWLLAGEHARARGAVADAQQLLTLGLDAAERIDDQEVASRIRLARGRARDALVSYPAAVDDFAHAVALARATGDRRLEMLALRELGGDAMLAMGEPIGNVADKLHSALRIAEALGDRVVESDALARLAVIGCSRLNFVDALEYGHRAVEAAYASGDERAVAVALDGLKTANAYLGELASLAPLLSELEPLLRRQNDLWRLSWTVQESAFAAIAAGRWDEAITRIEEARRINLRSGYLAYDAWFVGQLAWVSRLGGDLEQALAYGREAYDLTSGSTHFWWRSAALAQYGVAMLAAGDRDAGIAALVEGRTRASRDGAEAYRLRCVAPLAEATGDGRLLAEADAMLARIAAPTGCAWLLGAECYLAVGRAWLAAGSPDRAATVVAPLIAAAERNGWTWVYEAATGLIVASG